MSALGAEQAFLICDQTDTIERALKEKVDGKASDRRSEQCAQGQQSEVNTSIFLIDVPKVRDHGQ